MSKTCFVCCCQCSESNADIQQKFYVTNCYHVYCAGCLKNNKNFCEICKKKCKILPIDANLPKEVKVYFEQNFTQQLSTIAKVHEFQQTQVKNYVQKHYANRKKYYHAKQDMIQIMNYKKKLIENFKHEKSIMDKLKEAYRSNMITTDLFQMRSQAASPQGIKSPADIENTPANKMITSTPNSSSSLIFKNGNNNQESRTQEFRHNLTLSNFNRDSQTKDSQRSHFSGQKDVISDARKGLIASALRDMNKMSQNKQQVKNSQRQTARFKI